MTMMLLLMIFKPSGNFLPEKWEQISPLLQLGRSISRPVALNH